MGALLFSIVLTAYYDSDDPNPVLLAYSDAQLQGALSQALAQNKLSVKDAADPGTLSRAEKVALVALLQGKPGAEFDVYVERDGQLTPAEAQWNGDVLSVKLGKPRTEIYGKAAAKEELQKKYGVGPFVDSGATWDQRSLYVVGEALAQLSKDELKAIAGLPFHRMPKDPSGRARQGTAIAMYVPDKGQIELYDAGFDADRRKFLGPVEKPMPLTVTTVLHEIGHAISRRPLREARVKITSVKAEYDDLNAKVRALTDRNEQKKMLADINAKQREFEQLAQVMQMTDRRGSELERALEAKLPVRDSPTLYGRTSSAESFAECLALFKVDRAALDRAAPGVSAWFESAAYSALLK